MAWLKTKKVKKCICGKEPNAEIVYDDRMQSRTWLFRLGGLCLVIAIIGVLLGGYDSEVVKDSWWVLVLMAIFWLFFGYFLAKYRKAGHSLKCAARQAFLKVI